MERASRKICVEMGSIASTCKAPRTGAEVKQWGIHFTATKAIGIGAGCARRSAARRPDRRDPRRAGQAVVPRQGRRCRAPRHRRLSARPRASTASTKYRGSRLELAFQNEWVVAWRDGAPIAMSPDLICVLDTVSGNAFGTETIRYGMRVTVVALPAPPVFLTPEGLTCRPPRLRLRPRFQERVRVKAKTLSLDDIELLGVARLGCWAPAAAAIPTCCC